ncbi:MAG TPA: DUF2207 domain-containing protein [Gemmatimonadaceae bacterium]|nr:DUF2207 domain-containing protein [Gemmatimonadaceae bacterium]
MTGTGARFLAILLQCQRRVLSAALLSCVLAGAAMAQDQPRDIRIRDFAALLTVRSDGNVDVVEQLTIRFTGAWNGLNRDLSLHHNTAQGRAVKLDVEDGPITDASGRPLVVEHQTQDGGWTRRYHIYIPGAVDADRTIVIRYRVKNAIRFFFKKSDAGELDELYWNLTGNKWTMYIDSVHARVVLPDDVRPTQAAVYTGYAGSRETDAVIERDQNEVGFTARHPLMPYAGMTIAVGWPAGHIAGRPSEAHEALMEIVRWTPLLIPLLVFWFGYQRWDKYGRDPAEGSYVVRYEPVTGATPAELGTLVDHTADMPDITATLVDLAVRGYIHITELTEKHFFGLSTSTDYQFDIVRNRKDWNELKSHEVSYLDALSQVASTDAYSVKMSELRNKFYKFLPEIKNAIYDELVQAGYYVERPDRAKAKSWGIAVLIAFILGSVTILSLSRGFVLFAPAALVIATVVSLITLAIFAQIMPARTVEGARARESSLGFKEFLSRVEEDRFKRMITSPELFEKYLPYAMAFGVEENWANAFRDIYREPPQWYTGTGRFDSVSFGRSISSMSEAAASSMSSSPSSSGSGGGGSSGGGSGGGGGSGF